MAPPVQQREEKTTKADPFDAMVAEDAPAAKSAPAAGVVAEEEPSSKPEGVTFAGVRFDIPKTPDVMSVNMAAYFLLFALVVRRKKKKIDL